MKTFIENIGNTSTTASLNGKVIGHNVNASAYSLKDGSVAVYLESNASIVNKAGKMTFKDDVDFEKWKEDISENKELFLAAIESFGATTSF